MKSIQVNQLELESGGINYSHYIKLFILGALIRSFTFLKAQAVC